MTVGAWMMTETTHLNRRENTTILQFHLIHQTCSLIILPATDTGILHSLQGGSETVSH